MGPRTGTSAECADRSCRRSAVELFARGSIAALAMASEESPTTTVLALADASRLTTAMVPQSNSSPAGTAHYTDYGSEDLSKTAHIASALGGRRQRCGVAAQLRRGRAGVARGAAQEGCQVQEGEHGQDGAHELQEAGSPQVAFFGVNQLKKMYTPDTGSSAYTEDSPVNLHHPDYQEKTMVKQGLFLD